MACQWEVNSGGGDVNVPLNKYVLGDFSWQRWLIINTVKNRFVYRIILVTHISLSDRVKHNSLASAQYYLPSGSTSTRPLCKYLQKVFPILCCVDFLLELQIPTTVSNISTQTVHGSAEMSSSQQQGEELTDEGRTNGCSGWWSLKPTKDCRTKASYPYDETKRGISSFIPPVDFSTRPFFIVPSKSARPSSTSVQCSQYEITVCKTPSRWRDTECSDTGALCRGSFGIAKPIFQFFTIPPPMEPIRICNPGLRNQICSELNSLTMHSGIFPP